MNRVATITLLGLLLGGSGCDRPVSPSAHNQPISSATQSVRAAESAAPVAVSASASGRASDDLLLTFDSDAVGGPAAGVEAIIGDWVVAEHEGRRGLMVDGSRWRNGTASANLADQAKRLYGERYAEFLDGVKAFAFFPLAVVQKPPASGDIQMSVRFYPLGGHIDQAAGIAFGIEPDGSYVCIRANALEDNLLWARVSRGHRTILDTVRNIPTATKTWHTLMVSVRGNGLQVQLDGVRRFEKTLQTVPQGRVGLWSKADSQVLFDDFEVRPL